MIYCAWYSCWMRSLHASVFEASLLMILLWFLGKGTRWIFIFERKFTDNNIWELLVLLELLPELWSNCQYHNWLLYFLPSPFHFKQIDFKDFNYQTKWDSVQAITNQGHVSTGIDLMTVLICFNYSHTGSNHYELRFTFCGPNTSVKVI